MKKNVNIILKIIKTSDIKHITFNEIILMEIYYIFKYLYMNGRKQISLVKRIVFYEYVALL